MAALPVGRHVDAQLAQLALVELGEQRPVGLVRDRAVLPARELGLQAGGAGHVDPTLLGELPQAGDGRRSATTLGRDGHHATRPRVTVDDARRPAGRPAQRPPAGSARPASGRAAGTTGAPAAPPPASPRARRRGLVGGLVAGLVRTGARELGHRRAGGLRRHAAARDRAGRSTRRLPGLPPSTAAGASWWSRNAHSRGPRRVLGAPARRARRGARRGPSSGGSCAPVRRRAPARTARGGTTRSFSPATSRTWAAAGPPRSITRCPTGTRPTARSAGVDHRAEVGADVAGPARR